jgi:hypothetical protein
LSGNVEHEGEAGMDTCSPPSIDDTSHESQCAADAMAEASSIMAMDGLRDLSTRSSWSASTSTINVYLRLFRGGVGDGVVTGRVGGGGEWEWG